MDTETEAEAERKRAECCPMCINTRLISSIQPESFIYGCGPDKITLHVQVPVRRCMACGFTFTDYVAEEIRDTAIKTFKHDRDSK